MAREEQLELIPGVRLPPPACYEAVAEGIALLLEAEPSARKWGALRITEALRHYDGIPPSARGEDVLKSVKIYMERNGW